MFHTLASQPILRHLTSIAPRLPIVEADSGIAGEVTLRDYLIHIRQSGAMARFVAPAAADLVAARDAGTLGGPLEGPEHFDWLETWNAFLAQPAGTPLDGEAAATLSEPALRMIEGQFVMLVTKAKNATGAIRNHHLEQTVDMETALIRLARADEELASALRAGDTDRFGLGASIAREAEGSARVMFRGGRPAIEIRRPNAVHAWHAVELREIQPDEAFEPSF